MHCLSYSFEISSDFSGVGSWEDTLRWHLLELAYQLDRPPPTLLLWRMCDMDATCLNLLSSRTPGPCLLFANIKHRLPPGEFKQAMALLAMDQGDACSPWTTRFI